MNPKDGILKPTTPFLYKYGSANHLEWLEPILLRHHLYFPSPRELNDPREARPPLKVSSRAGALRRLVNPFLARHAGDSFESLALDVRNMARIVNAGSLDDLAAFIAPALHIPLEEHRIYSMTTRPDNDHLWAQYADGYAGYCLEFERSGVFGFAVHVIYEDEAEIDFSDPDSLDWKFLIRKVPAYAPEEEVRILRLPRGQPHEVVFAPRLLRRVILGRNMTEKNRETIRQWCRVRIPALLAEDE